MTLLADAPNNPFAQDISVALPQGDAEADVSSRNDQLRGVAGAIVKLPYDWQAVADFSWAKNRYTADKSPSNYTPGLTLLLGSGSQDVLRDLRLDPLDLTYIDSDFGSITTPSGTMEEMPARSISGISNPPIGSLARSSMRPPINSVSMSASRLSSAP